VCEEKFFSIKMLLEFSRLSEGIFNLSETRVENFLMSI